MNLEERRKNALTAAREILEKEFDVVQIFGASYDQTTRDTQSYNMGCGIWHGRIGLVREWLGIETAREQVYATHKAQKQIDEGEDQPPEPL